jgi:mitogen-activated protein kinase 1/3
LSNELRLFQPGAPPIPENFFDFDRYKDQLTKEQLKRKCQRRRPQRVMMDVAMYLIFEILFPFTEMLFDEIMH